MDRPDSRRRASATRWVLVLQTIVIKFALVEGPDRLCAVASFVNVLKLSFLYICWQAVAMIWLVCVSLLSVFAMKGADCGYSACLGSSYADYGHSAAAAYVYYCLISFMSTAEPPRKRQALLAATPGHQALPTPHPVGNPGECGGAVSLAVS